MKGIRSVVVALAVLVAAPVAPAQPVRDTLTIGVNQFPANWHPSIEAMATKAYIHGMVRRPFTAYDADWRLVCLLCTELPSVEAGTAVFETRADGSKGVAVTFTIRPDAVWGDGTPITTDDVLFTWAVGKHPQSGFANGDLYSRDIRAIDVSGPKTFTIHRDKPVCDFAAINDFRVLPAHLERAVFEADPATYKNRSRFETDTTNPGLYFGPYRIATVASGSHVVLERNPTWSGAEPAFRRVIVRAVENSAALEANLRAGQIDMIAGEAGLPINQALALEKREPDRFVFHYKPGLVYEHIDLKLDDPILRDVRVRRALLHAIDRGAVSDQLFGGRQAVAHNQVNPLDRVHAAGYPTYPYDPAAAARLLDEAGWTGPRGGIRTNAAGERLSLEFMTTAGDRTRELVQQVLQAQWKQAGIEVRIRNEPARVLFGQTLKERRYTGMAMYAWISSPDNVPKTILHSSMIPTAANGWAGQNTAGYADPEMDEVIDRLEHVCREPERQALWNRLQELYARDLPALPLYFRSEPYILPPWLVNLVPTGHQNFSTLWIEHWRVK